jgi:predicted amidohydrolase YtcJ
MNAIIDVRQNYPGKNPRHYIIHAESLGRPEQAKKAARYNIPYSVQPAIADHAFEPTLDLIGARGARCFDLRTPLEEGVILCGGSDAIAGVFPNWRMAVQSAVTRRSAFTGNVYAPDLRISVEEAVRMFTINAVYQEGQEEVRGSIEVGKVADFQVLDRNIFETPAEEIGSVKVLMTIVGGKVVYQMQ